MRKKVIHTKFIHESFDLANLWLIFVFKISTRRENGKRVEYKIERWGHRGDKEVAIQKKLI